MGKNLNFTHVFDRACKAFEEPSELGGQGDRGTGRQGDKGTPSSDYDRSVNPIPSRDGAEYAQTLIICPPQRIYRPSYGPRLLRNWSKHGLVPRLFMRSFRLHPWNQVNSISLPSTRFRAVHKLMEVDTRPILQRDRSLTTLTKVCSLWTTYPPPVDFSGSFLQRQLIIANYHVKKFVRKSQ